MISARKGRLHTIAPGVPFLRAVAKALCEGRLVETFRHDRADPLGLARATIFVPTRRAARVLRSEFVDLLGGGSAILPVIRPLGEVDDDAGFFDSAVPATLDLDPPIGGVARLLELGQLILAWKQALPKAVSDMHADNPLIAPANPADAIWLARALADLLEAMETEERPWSALDVLDTADHAAWWQLTLEFLHIATRFWPDRLAELRRSSPAAHRNALLRAEARRLEAAPPAGPVVVAGSTGSLPATAELIGTVMRLEHGAVVLPGLDHAIEPAHWPLVGGIAAAGDASQTGEAVDPAVRTHPQYGLYRLLEMLACTRDDAAPLELPPETLIERNRIVSLAMLPTAATAVWADPGRRPDEKTVAAALSDVSLIEAANEREEAQAIAVALRLALEADASAASQVALVTPDRQLARRVAVELRRFGIEADDSAGTPLGSTPQGTLLTLVVQAALEPGDPVALLALLKHPLARFGWSAATARHAARALELTALRAGTGEVDAADLGEFVDRRLAARDDHPPLWRSRLGEADRTLARALAARVEAAVRPLAGKLVRRLDPDGEGGMTTSFPAAVWGRATAQVLEAIAGDEDGRLDTLWGDEAGETLAELLSGVIESEAGLDLQDGEWVAMMPALIAGETVKPRAGAHPGVFIWGALEARLQHVDTIVLGALNEGTWPGQTANDPFLSRSMKTAIGLEPPERRIGQAAHDVQMALGAPRVVLARAARAGSAPTVASRWLQRLAAVAGEEATAAMRQRGRRYLDWAEALDSSAPAAMAERPEPRPPRDRQPANYSFSEVKTLRRDPYAIYARRILRLDPIDAMVSDPSVAERGTLYHAILEEFARTGVRASDPAALARMQALTDKHFAAEKLPPHVAAIWRPRFDRVAELFLAWQRENEGGIAGTVVEARARHALGASGFSLSGMADRIDLLNEGGARIIDYKTGTSPSAKQARVLLDPQLALEAGVLAAGGFRGIAPTPACELLYVRLKPEDRLKVDRVDNKKPDKPDTRSAEELGEEAIEQFLGFVALLASGRRGFASRIIPASARDFGGEYDHLARVAEWSAAEAGENGDA